MHAAATLIYLALAPLAQSGGGYGENYAPNVSTEAGPRQSVTASARTRSIRPGSDGLHGNYPQERVANNPRYATAGEGLPPVDDGRNVRSASEDPRSSLAKTLLTDLIAPQDNGSSQPLKLYDTLERTAGTQQQFTAIKAYWEWTLSVAELQGAAEEHLVLQRLGAGKTPFEQAFLVAQVKAAHARVEDSKLDVAARLVDLRTATGMRAGNAPPRPADTPWVGAYDTKFDRLFAGRTAPASLTRINKTLPFAINVVRVRADAYNSSRHALLSAEEGFPRGQTTLHDLIEGLALVRNQRRAFLDSVHDYNFEIAEYALSVAGPSIQRETVVTMLIPTVGRYRGASYSPNNNDILPVSGEMESSDTTWGNYSVQRPALSIFEAGNPSTVRTSVLR